MMKHWRVVTIVAVLFVTMILSGCSTREIVGMPPGSPMMPSKSKSDKMIVDVYWDATVSMKGFTTLAAGNIYRTLPDMLGELGGILGEVHFFRFGEKVVPLEGRDYRRFRDSDCYTEKTTSFGNVLDQTDPNNLSVVITDLFEDDADWSNITQKLRAKYFPQHLTVAIIGVKNSFYGKIYDAGINAASFNYDSKDDPARFRPFYLFLMGSESQVQAFLERWKDKMSSENIKPENIKYAVFSEYFATYDIKKYSLDENLYGDDELIKTDSRLREAGVNDPKSKASFTIHGNLKKNEDCCSVRDKTSLEHPPVKVFIWSDTAVKGASVENDNDAEKDSSDKKNNSAENDTEVGLLDKIFSWFGNDDDAKKDSSDKKDSSAENDKEVDKGVQSQWQELESNGAEAKFVWNDDNTFTLNVTFNPEITLPKGKIGLIQVLVAPSREDLQLPEWISQWDMGDIDAAPNQLDGSKTFNLKRIAASLKDYLMDSANPTIAELYLVIKKH